jgi:hypothetical protein
MMKTDNAARVNPTRGGCGSIYRAQLPSVQADILNQVKLPFGTPDTKTQLRVFTHICPATFDRLNVVLFPAPAEGLWEIAESLFLDLDRFYCSSA